MYPFCPCGESSAIFAASTEHLIQHAMFRNLTPNKSGHCYCMQGAIKNVPTASLMLWGAG